MQTPHREDVSVFPGGNNAGPLWPSKENDEPKCPRSAWKITTMKIKGGTRGNWRFAKAAAARQAGHKDASS